MIPKKIFAYLAKHKISYEHIPHKQVFTTFDLAQTLKEKMDKIAKTLLVKVDKKYVLVVLPAHYRLDLEKVKKVLKSKTAVLAPEKVMREVFKVKPGSMTPFAGIHKVEGYVDKALLKTKHAIVSAGSFTDSLRLKAKDLAKLENMTVATLGIKAKAKIKRVLKKKKR